MRNSRITINAFSGFPTTAFRQARTIMIAVLGLAGMMSISCVSAETFVLEGGTTLQGAIIQTTRNGVVIKRSVSGMAQYRHDEIQEVIIDSPNGTITGNFVGWADGVYALEVKDRVVRVQDGRIVGTGLGTLPIVKRVPSDRPVTDDDTRSDEADPVLVEGVGGPIEHVKPIMITGTTEPIRESEPAVVYNLRLSRDADEEIILIYATIADTAQPDSDFVAESGLITIEPGESEARIQVSLVNDHIAEDKENFHIYLTADTTLVDLPTRTIIATILDDD